MINWAKQWWKKHVGHRGYVVVGSTADGRSYCLRGIRTMKRAGEIASELNEDSMFDGDGWHFTYLPERWFEKWAVKNTTS